MIIFIIGLLPVGKVPTEPPPDQALEVTISVVEWPLW